MSPNGTSSQSETGVSKMKPLVPTTHTHTQTDEQSDTTVLHLCLDMARLLKGRLKGKIDRIHFSDCNPYSGVELNS